MVVCPADAVHGHPLVVLDACGRIHLPLTVYARVARRQLSAGSARAYLAALLPFFGSLECGDELSTVGDGWAAEPKTVRRLVANYLNDRFGCLVRQHRLGFQLVRQTSQSPAGVRVFLSALKLFYRVMREEDFYLDENPLIDPLSAALQLRGAEVADRPLMPDRSGVVEPRHRRRLSDSYFKFQGDEWVPQIVDDPTLPARILAGGQASRWQLRETCVTRLLFETGGRVSEVVGLSLGDWWIRGLRQEVSAFSKGSHQRRIKYLRFSTNTAKLLRRYVDGERRQRDPDHRTLGEYCRLGDGGELDLFTVPLFLSRRGTALSAAHFRDHYWAPACQAAGLDADVHQARHWYVTMAVRQIYEAAQTDAEIRRRLRELIEYMKWRRGWETIQAYDHYFDAERHAEIQDALHRRLDASLKAGLAGRMRRQASAPRASSRIGVLVPKMPPEDPELRFLEELLG